MNPLQLLLNILAPGEKLPPGATQFTIDHEGLSWGWAFFIFVVLAVAVVVSYRIFAPRLSHFHRTGLVTLRCILIALLLILLVKPVLLLTIEETIRRPFLVLLDQTQSMSIVDRRSNPEDAVREAIAQGAVDPDAGLKATPPEGLKDVSRIDLLNAIAANQKLNLWPRIDEHAGIHFFGFGRKLGDIGDLAPPEGSKLSTDDSSAFFQKLHYDEDLTGIGNGLRDLLDAERGQPLSGILLITDGGNNTGMSPVEAAAIAKEDGVPLFIYGVGVTSPQDIMVAELDGPQTSNVKEKLSMTVRIRAQSMIGKKAVVQLKADGKVVDEEPIEFRADGEQEITVSYTPQDTGIVNLEAYVPPLPEEAVKDNNSAKTTVRIVDDKIKVLYVETEPTWDYQYILAMLQRDRRIKLKVVLIKGDADLLTEPDTPFLARIPDDRDTLFANDLVILGDVDPNDLGPDRMKMLSEWVSKMGGGMLFKAGPKFNPNAYHDTPLEPMLPVEAEGKTADEYDDPVQLKLTPTGEASPIVSVSDDPQENLAIWGGFPGVRWTAWVDQARPGAQVLLVDPTSSRANSEGPEPVMAMENYGLGQTFYIGTDETYRWRSKIGEKYFTRIYGQIIQTLTAQHMAGASQLLQLKTDRASYLTGDKVKIYGRIFQAGFTPVTDAEVPGTLTITPEAKPGKPAPTAQTQDVRLEAIPDQPGEYKAEVTAQVAGSYSYSVARDPSVTTKFQVDEPRIEMADIAMNEKLLKSMASASGGTYLREENLDELPQMIVDKTAKNVSFKKIPLAYAPALLGLIIFIACLEWLWRRKLELK